MKRVSMKRFVSASTPLVFAALFMCSGCASIQVKTQPYTAGRILLLPPRDLVQNGTPHPKGAGSGLVFQNYLKSRFVGTAFTLMTTDDSGFSALEIAAKEKGLDEAKKLKANYCLQIVLGEFQNAAPMTFRPDYAHLDQAIMYEVRTGEIVWQLAEPLRAQKGNIGNHLKLLDDLAEAVAASIVNNVRRTTP